MDNQNIDKSQQLNKSRKGNPNCGIYTNSHGLNDIITSRLFIQKGLRYVFLEIH